MASGTVATRSASAVHFPHRARGSGKRSAPMRPMPGCISSMARWTSQPTVATILCTDAASLRVSQNQRYLAYADDTPFLWIGDTAWAAPTRASDEEWEAYLTDRADKGFSLIQVAPAPSWAGSTDREGARPFTDETCVAMEPGLLAVVRTQDSTCEREGTRGAACRTDGTGRPLSRVQQGLPVCSEYCGATVRRLRDLLAELSTASSCRWPTRWGVRPAKPPPYT